MLSAINCDKKILAFTEKSLFDKVKKEQDIGRFPPMKSIEVRQVDLDDKMKAIIADIRMNSQKELKK